MPSTPLIDHSISRWATFRLAVIVFVLYLLADFGMNMYALGDGWTILWPLNGITVGLLLMRPRRQWAAIVIAVSIGLGIGEHFDNHNSLFQSLVARGCSAAEVLICAFILPPFTSLESWLRSRMLSLRLYCALLLGPGLSAIPVVFFAPYRPQSMLLSFNDWATADALGIAATLPFVLALRTPEMRALFQPANILRTVAVLGLCFGSVFLIFSYSRYPFFFVLYPALLLVDLLLSFAGASLAVLCVSIFSVYLVMHHPGPLIVSLGLDHIQRNVGLQVYLGFHLLALFPASIVLLERRRMTGELKDANAQLTLLASIDGLTGISLRRPFDERLTAECRVAVRTQSPIALLMVDLDHFKQYNDTYGHPAGDACLRTIAGVLTEVARRPRDLAARYGGEEFIVMLPDTSLEAALELAETLRDAVYACGIEHTGSSFGVVTVSIGCISAIPELGEPPSALLDLADRALYRAKATGRNAVHAGPVPQAAA